MKTYLKLKPDFENILLTQLVVLFLFIFSFNTHANQDNKTIHLFPTTEFNSRTLVSMGIPFAPGQLNDTRNLRLFNEVNEEVQVFVKPTLFWHWKPSGKNTIRAVKIQFYVDNAIEHKAYKFTLDTDRDVTFDLEEQEYALGIQTSSNPLKASMQYPKITTVINSDWLAQSQIIPPFIAMQNDYQQSFWQSQFNWAKELDFTNMNLANWLFDRVSALYKGCMRNASVECYQEAFLSFRFWINHIDREGGVNGCQGGLAISSKEQKACDTKYVYIEPIKIHLALTGDDTLFDENLVNDMATLSRENFYYQPNTADPYNTQNEPFTERAAGISLLAQISAFEILGDESILDDIERRIETLYQHQLNNPDGLNPDGSFRHAWSRHEGANYPGDDNFDDRRFSPWMSENIIDALWHSYHIINDERIGEILRFTSEAIEEWGFADSNGYIEKFGSSLHDMPNGASWKSSCNKNGSIVLYSGSSTADSKALIKTQNNDGWYSDSHNPEIILALAVGYYFETDINKANKLRSRILSIRDNYLNSECGKNKSTKRMFNWNNRSNYWGTYLWVLNQKGETDTYESPSAEEGSDESVTIPEFTYNKELSDDFNQPLSQFWLKNTYWKLENNTLVSTHSGQLLIEQLPNINGPYAISLDLNTTENFKIGKSIVFSGNGSEFFTARIRGGTWGGVYIYHHIAPWDLGGRLLSSKNLETLYAPVYRLKVIVNSSNAKVYIDNILQLDFTHEFPFENNALGVFTQGVLSSADNFSFKYTD